MKSPEPADAATFLDFFRAVCGETDFLLFRPEEVSYIVEEEAGIIRSFLEDERKALIAIFDGKRIVANIGIQPVGKAEKLRHRAKIGISVRKEYWGQGLGSLLIQEAETATRRMGFERLELDVFTANSRALLYQHLGFIQCGCIPRAARLTDGSYSDEIYMTKAL